MSLHVRQEYLTVHFATIVTIILASRAFTSSDRACSRLGETKTGTQITEERFNSQSAIYERDLEKDERQVAEWYNALSGSYDELYTQEQSRKYETVLGFLGNRHFKVLIDIGCGTGTFLEKASEMYDYAIVIDLSAKMLLIARKRNNANNDSVLSSSYSLPLKTSSYE